MVVCSYKELVGVFDRALSYVKERDKDYEGYWLREDIDFLKQNIHRKAEAIKVLSKNGSLSTPKGMEQLIDLINYSAMVYKRLEMEIENK